MFNYIKSLHNFAMNDNGWIYATYMITLMYITMVTAVLLMGLLMEFPVLILLIPFLSTAVVINSYNKEKNDVQE